MHHASAESTSKPDGGSEARAGRLAESLRPWRQVVVRADAILHWERPLGLACLLGAVTLTFALLALCRPAPLCVSALICLLVVAADLAVPRLAPLLLGDAWSDADQACYAAVCQRLLARWDAAGAAVGCAARSRRDRPQAFAAAAGGALLAAAFIGCCVSGIFLAYAGALAAALWPGVTRYGLLHRAARDLKACVWGKAFGKCG